jgi:Mn2+/Fe2+ NRAMP family transporter
VRSHPPLHAPLPTEATADPPRGWRAIASQLGPGLIISAAIVGSGELIVTPKLGAAHGFTLLWFVILACVVKVFVQIELARLAIVERITTLEALDRIPGPRLRVSWLLWLWLLMYIGLVFQVGGIIGGVVLVCQTMGFAWSPMVALIGVTGSCALLSSRAATGRWKQPRR